MLLSLRSCGRTYFCRRESGACADWLADSCPLIQKVSQTVCGPLLTELAEHIEHGDMESPAYFKHGVLPLCFQFS